MKIAVIDIGSNSVRCLISKLGKKPKALAKKTITTKLGEGLSINGKLKQENINQTIEVVLNFRKIALEQGAKKVYVFATEAVRKAENRDSLLIPLKSKNIEVDILTPEEEAKCAFLGATTPFKDLNGKKVAVLDVGGGSTEFAYGQDGVVEYYASQSIGSRRIKELCGTNKGLLDKFINSTLNEYKNALLIDEFIATGGTATTIASVLLGLDVYDSSKIEGFVVTKQALHELLCKLFTMSESQIRSIKGLYKERADIILGGVYFTYRMMEHYRANSFKVVDSDNMEGYVMIKA